MIHAKPVLFLEIDLMYDGTVASTEAIIEKFMSDVVVDDIIEIIRKRIFMSWSL